MVTIDPKTSEGYVIMHSWSEYPNVHDYSAQGLWVKDESFKFSQHAFCFNLGDQLFFCNLSTAIKTALLDPSNMRIFLTRTTKILPRLIQTNFDDKNTKLPKEVVQFRSLLSSLLPSTLFQQAKVSGIYV